MSIASLSLHASIAAEPVSPDVAPTIVIFSEFSEVGIGTALY